LTSYLTITVDDSLYSFAQFDDGYGAVAKYANLLKSGKVVRKELAPLRLRVSYASLASYKSIVIYLTGGYELSKGIPSKKAIAYDLRTQTVNAALPDLNQARYYHSSCTLCTKLYVFSGCDRHERLLNSLEVLNLAKENNLWKLVPLVDFPARGEAVVCPVSETEILIMGGRTYRRHS